jgi:hypothetical protein
LSRLWFNVQTKAASVRSIAVSEKVYRKEGWGANEQMRVQMNKDFFGAQALACEFVYCFQSAPIRVICGKTFRFQISVISQSAVSFGFS